MFLSFGRKTYLKKGKFIALLNNKANNIFFTFGRSTSVGEKIAEFIGLLNNRANNRFFNLGRETRLREGKH